MAFNKAPSNWLGAGYSLTSSQIIMNTATHAAPVTLPELTDAEANATTGDIRKLLYALCEQLFQAWDGKATADQPTKMTIRKSASVNPSTGAITNRYGFDFVITPTGTEVSDEPA